MKRKILLIAVGGLVALLSLLGVPAYAGGHGGGGRGHGGFSGGGHAGFSGGGRTGFAGSARSYSGAGISRGSSTYAPRSYPSGISTGRYGAYGQRYYARTSTGEQIHRSSSSLQNRTASSQFDRSPKYSGSYYVPRDQSGVGFARKSDMQSRYNSGANRDLRQQRAITSAKGAARPGSTWSRQNIANKQKLDRQTTERLRNWHGKASGWNDAKNKNQEHWRDRNHHGHDWWHHHCDAIVLIGWGYWGWWDGWWYPAWGFDPYYSYYDYNEPIYGYDGLQPDEVIADVQAALQQLGYYSYAADGVLGPATEAAIANYQRDYGLPVTGAIDPATVGSLGLTT
jgi:Putative peptidoglycan binding domain